MTIVTAAISIRFGVEEGKPTSPDLNQWHLGDPAPPGEERTRATAVFDYAGVPPFEVVDDHVWMFIYLEGQVVDHRRFRVLRTWDGDFETQSLLLEHDVAELWRQVYLLMMLTNPPRMAASFLKTEVQRWGWIGATVAYSGVTTPWLWGDQKRERDFVITQPVPERLQLTLEPKMFASRSIFYSHVGERLLGFAGYAGRDLQGFNEIMRRLQDLTKQIDVQLVDSNECEQVANQIARGFFADVQDVLRETTNLRVQ